MRALIPVLTLAVLTLGCDGNNGTDEDTTTADTLEVIDTAVDTSAEVEDTTDEPDADDAAETGCIMNPQCDDEDPCTLDTCDIATGVCSNAALDVDEDGYFAQVGTDGTTDCGGNDCDDEDDEIFPDSTVRRCGEDADCNGRTDSDNDNDGHVSDDCGGPDCEDDDAAINPDATIGCTADDVDCNGNVDSDNDGDGHDRVECSGDDCDDLSAFVYPDAPEICSDGIDQDCDTIVDGPGTVLPEVFVAYANVDDRPGLVWTGSEFGAVWVFTPLSTRDIIFARLDMLGSVVGSTVNLSSSDDQDSQPDITWTGSEFAVAWRSGSLAIDSTIDMGRIAADGTLLGDSTVSANPTDSNAEFPAITWTGTEYGVAWHDLRDGDSDIYLARVDASGTKVGSDHAVTDTTSSPQDATIVWTGLSYVACWEDGSFMSCGRIAGDGALVGSPVGMTLSSSRDPEAVWTGSQIGLVFEDPRETGGGDTWFIRLDESLYEIGSDTRINTDPIGLNPDVVWTGTNWVFTWRNSSMDLMFASLDSDGVAVGSNIELNPGTSLADTEPQLAWTGSNFGLFWHGSISTHSVWYNLVGYCE